MGDGNCFAIDSFATFGINRRKLYKRNAFAAFTFAPFAWKTNSKLGVFYN